jgi:ribosomal protein S18 acetylase RimI-like enzyme
VIVQLVPMTEVCFAAYLESSVADYAGDNVRAGRWTADEALKLSRAEFNRLLPQGLGTPGQHLFEVVAEPGPRRVGMIWVSLPAGPAPAGAFIYDIRIDPDQRGKGYGSAAIQGVEDFARTKGASRMGLNVFAHNPNARRLYAKRGYLTVAEQMAKSLDPLPRTGTDSRV